MVKSCATSAAAVAVTRRCGAGQAEESAGAGALHPKVSICHASRGIIESHEALGKAACNKPSSLWWHTLAVALLQVHIAIEPLTADQIPHLVAS